MLLFLLLLLRPSPGEQLRYEVRFGFLKAGQLLLEVLPDTVVAGDSAWHFRLIASTTGAVRHLLPLDDTLASYVGKRTFRTLLQRKRFREKRYQARRETFYDHRSGRAIYSDGDTVAFPPGALDPLAAVYLLRFRPLGEGEILRLPYHADKRSGEIRLIAESLEEKRRLLPVRVEGAKGGLIKGSRGFRLWIDPETGIPEEIEIHLAFGTLRGRLVKNHARGGTRTRTGIPTRS